MKRFPFYDTRDLTISFRFGKKIADLASTFIREAKGEKRFRIKGNPEKSSKVAFYSELPLLKAGERCAILSRTNLALFEKALGLRSRGIPFTLEGNISAVLGRILDVHWLSTKAHDRIWDRFIQSFESLDSLDIYARDLDDFHLAGMIKVVREYAHLLPNAVFDMLATSKNTNGKSKDPCIILSTVHGVKGQEYDRAYIDLDLAAAFSRPPGLEAPQFGDEANIAYVAFTRAIRELYLPLDFKTILTSEWQAAMKRYEPVNSPRPPRSPQPKRVRKAFRAPSGKRSIQFATDTPKPRPTRKKPFKIGDRVHTNHGTGTVVEIDGEKYLVDLDGQGAKLWTKDWALWKA